MSKFYSVKEASEYLQIKESTLYSWVAKDKIPAYKFGRLLRFRVDELEAWAEAQKSNNTEFPDHIPVVTSNVNKVIEHAAGSVLSFSQGKARSASLEGGD